METPNTTSIQNLINSLTDDEDLRQELWVLWLSGTSPCNLHGKLLIIMLENDLIIRVSDYAYSVMSDTNDFTSKIQCLYSIERAIITLIASGVKLETISRYKGISLIRLKQMLFSIQTAPFWMALKDKSDAKEET